jgi:ADP-ribosylation factor-like protein 8
MGFILSKLFSKKLEMCILGLEGCGKTTFVNQLMGENKKTVPTIGLNVKSYKKGSLSMKIWDIGGQFQYRPNWVDYAKLCDVIVFLVDSSNVRKLYYNNYNSMIQYHLQNKNFKLYWIIRE